MPTFYCPQCGFSRSHSEYSPIGEAPRPTGCKSKHCGFTTAKGITTIDLSSGDSTTIHPVFLTKTERDLKSEIRKELDYFHQFELGHKAGVDIPACSTGTAGYRDQVQHANGGICHSCNTDAKTDPDQPWIGDHVPSTSLNATLADEIRALKKIPAGRTYLFPHCHVCSAKQAQVVRNHRFTNALKFVASSDRKYLVGKTKPKLWVNCIIATGPVVDASQGLQIQKIGTQQGCHCCGTKYPAPIYDADHVFPREFCTNYMQRLFEKLGLTYPTKFYLAPQCKRCSTHQGGTLSGLARKAQAAARGLRITVYK